MSEYRPYQHVAQPQGESHRTLYASVELWLDRVPDAIILGEHRYVLDKRKGDDVGCDQSS